MKQTRHRNDTAEVIADLYSVTGRYVRQIATGVRKAESPKAKAIKAAYTQLTSGKMRLIEEIKKQHAL